MEKMIDLKNYTRDQLQAMDDALTEYGSRVIDKYAFILIEIGYFDFATDLKKALYDRIKEEERSMGYEEN